jgi:hypothetical protein
MEVDVKTPHSERWFDLGQIERSPLLARIRPKSRPQVTARGKNTGKIVKERAENGGNWRIFESPKRQFAVLRAGYARSQHTPSPDFTFARRGSLAWRLDR